MEKHDKLRNLQSLVDSGKPYRGVYKKLLPLMEVGDEFYIYKEIPYEIRMQVRYNLRKCVTKNATNLGLNPSTFKVEFIKEDKRILGLTIIKIE